MPKVAPQLSRFKKKEMRSQKQYAEDQKNVRPAFVQTGKPIHFGPGWEKLGAEEKAEIQKEVHPKALIQDEGFQEITRRKTKPPRRRNAFRTHQQARKYDKFLSQGRKKVTQATKPPIEEISVPVVPVPETKKSVISKLASMAESSLDLVTSGITGRFRKKQT